MDLEIEIYQVLKKNKLSLKKREDIIDDLLNLIKQDRAEQLILSGVGSSFLNELIEKHKANKKLALDSCKKMKDSNQYPWYDATFNNELLFVFDLEDLKIRSGL